MITNIKINGFKSFQNFEMEFAPFTVIAGANASGKSNLFDAIMLLARLAETDNLKKAFQEQRGEFIELFTQYDENEYATEMQFCVEIMVNKEEQNKDKEESNLAYTHLEYEIRIKRFTNEIGIEDVKLVHEQLVNHNKKEFYIKFIEEADLFEVKDGTLGSPLHIPMKDNISRTMLSNLAITIFPNIFAAKEEMKSWKLLQLNPKDLSDSTSKENGTDIISQSGKNLAAVLHRIKQEDEYNLIEISRKLQRFIPHFIEVISIDDKENRSYSIKLKDSDKKIYSKVLSEGTLRILALCILESDSKSTGLLCFEEPENGIHPAHIKNMVELLKELSEDFEGKLRQVIVNTHSPVFAGEIINYILTDNDEKNVSFNLFRIAKIATYVNNKKVSISQTKMINPLLGYKKTELGGTFTTVEREDIRKNALYSVKKYIDASSFNRLEEKIEKLKKNTFKHSLNR